MEKWIDATISQDGLSDKALIAKVRNSYRKSMQANIDYHTELAKTMLGGEETQSAKKHTLFANVYRALIE